MPWTIYFEDLKLCFTSVQQFHIKVFKMSTENITGVIILILTSLSKLKFNHDIFFKFSIQYRTRTTVYMLLDKYKKVVISIKINSEGMSSLCFLN